MLRAAGCSEACKQAKQQGARSTLRHRCAKVSLGSYFVDHALVSRAGERFRKAGCALVRVGGAMQTSQGFDRDHLSLLAQDALWKACSLLVGKLQSVAGRSVERAPRPLEQGGLARRLAWRGR